jgi:hypothetical protein
MQRIFMTLFLIALGFTLTMAWLPHPPAVPGNPNDKVQHIAAFAVLSVLGGIAFPTFPLPRLGERLSFLGAIIEVVQNLPALHRDCDIRDWLADTAAILITLTLIHFVKARFITARQERSRRNVRSQAQ